MKKNEIVWNIPNYTAKGVKSQLATVENIYGAQGWAPIRQVKSLRIVMVEGWVAAARMTRRTGTRPKGGGGGATQNSRKTAEGELLQKKHQKVLP